MSTIIKALEPKMHDSSSRDTCKENRGKCFYIRRLALVVKTTVTLN